MTLTGKAFTAGALAALLGFPISSVLAQSSTTMDASGSSASPPASRSMSAGASSSAPSSMNDSSASASAPAAQSAQIDDATLQKAAKAYVKVKKIVHETKQASPTSASAAPDQAKIAAVKDSGLDPQQYNQVIQTVQADPQLQQKFASYVTQNGGDTD